MFVPTILGALAPWPEQQEGASLSYKGASRVSKLVALNLDPSPSLQVLLKGNPGFVQPLFNVVQTQLKLSNIYGSSKSCDQVRKIRSFVRCNPSRANCLNDCS